LIDNKYSVVINQEHSSYKRISNICQGMNLIEKDFILLIPCYNNYDGLVKSIRSVCYSKNKFEILIVDDGSDVLIDQQKLQELNPEINIQIIRLQENNGIAVALNAGLKTLNIRNDFKYIARLDCGDVCHPDRFTKQVAFLNEHNEIGLLGTWCRFIDKNTGKSYLYKTKQKQEDIVKEMHFKCSFIHPTVMFRKNVLDVVGYYPKEFIHAEDYAYFWQILKKMKGAVLGETLVDVEFSGSNVSAKNYRRQLRSRMKVVRMFGEKKRYVLSGIFLVLIRYLLPFRLIKEMKF
jgi:glycosyltransferase involved in cell wall biosynthesis